MFLPDEDQGFLFVMAVLPAGSTQDRTLDVAKRVEEYFLTKEKDTVASALSVVGFSFAGRGQNTAMCFVRLKDWDVRKSPELKLEGSWRPRRRNSRPCTHYKI